MCRHQKLPRRLIVNGVGCIVARKSFCIFILDLVGRRRLDRRNSSVWFEQIPIFIIDTCLLLSEIRKTIKVGILQITHGEIVHRSKGELAPEMKKYTTGTRQRVVFETRGLDMQQHRRSWLPAWKKCTEDCQDASSRDSRLAPVDDHPSNLLHQSSKLSRDRVCCKKRSGYAMSARLFNRSLTATIRDMMVDACSQEVPELGRVSLLKHKALQRGRTQVHLGVRDQAKVTIEVQHGVERVSPSLYAERPFFNNSIFYSIPTADSYPPSYSTRRRR
ncbi:hypothetical protein E6O75_ATG06534 [Venturia nashicola]|uniref:Uncharacterized protein n=1 Tax=Venturia nashicola TaxID=86259 RepID=A0A4Z1PBU7_9PEZI|nr:hypothetical protein E6O75_ATG06534 [Venturia nashicola]